MSRSLVPLATMTALAVVIGIFNIAPRGLTAPQGAGGPSTMAGRSPDEEIREIESLIYDLRKIADPLVALVQLRRQRLLAKYRGEGCFLAAEFPITLEGRYCHVLVFVPAIQVIPGRNPQTIVIADKFSAELSSIRVDEE
jgi:hypothetical protein